MRDEEKTKEQILSENQSLRKELADLKASECECKWIEAALKESEERYRRLLESITDYIYTVKGENGRPVSTTHGPGCLAVTGHTSEYFQIHPHLWYEMIHEDDREEVLKQIEKVLSGGAVQPIEHRIIHKDGSIRCIRNTTVPHFDKDGKLIAYDGIIEDITDRKLAEKELRLKAELLDAASDSIFLHDTEGNPLYVNRAAYMQRGYSKEELLAMNLRDLDTPEYASLIDARMKTIMEKGNLVFEAAHFRKDRSVMPIEVHVRAIEHEGRRLILGVTRDITERKKAEEALRQGKREWEQTFDSISAPLFIHDREFRVVRANRAYADVAGMKFKEFMGRPYYEVFPKMEGPFKMCLKALELQEDEEDEDEDEDEDEFSCPLTNRIFKVIFNPIKDGNGKYLYSILILEDITEAKKAEERMKEEMEVTSHLLTIAEATAKVTDVGGLRKEIVACVQKILGCEICLLYLWDAEAKRFNPEQESGLAREEIPQFMTETLNSNMMFVKRVLSGKEPVVIARSIDDLLMIVGDERKGLALSWLPFGDTIAGILLVTKKAPLGFVLAVFKQEKDFKDRDLQVMRGMSSQVSIAIEQARLYREAIDKALELSNKIETINVMKEIDRGILSTLDPQEILETAMMMITRVVSCDRATVALADKERKEFLYAAGFGTTAIAKGIFVPFEDTSAAKVLETGRLEYIANLERIGELLPLETAFLKEGFLSHIRHPLIVKEEVVGVLSIGSKRPSAFTPTDLSTIEKLAYQIGVALQNARQLKDLEDLFLGTVKSLSAAIDAKSPWTAGHSERVTKDALDIAKQMGLPEKELKDLELAGLLHDVGKIGTYESILDKPGKLDDAEQAAMRLHPVKGAEILAPIKQLKDIIPGVKHHHEFYDGTGYPEGLKGDAIPLHARILTVADAVDAMGADRPYRKGRSMDIVIAELKRCSETQFDPKVVEAFLSKIA